MKKPIIITILVFALFVLLINLVFQEPKFKRMEDEIRFALQTGHPERADSLMFLMVERQIDQIAVHSQYIHNHFSIPFSYKTDAYHFRNRNDSSLTTFYKRLSNSDKQNLADIGHYGLGLIFINEDNYNDALNEYHLVKNNNLPFLNNSIAYVWLKLDRPEKAEFYLRQEIQLDGNLDGAYPNLIEAFHRQNKTRELDSLMRNEELASYFSFQERREYYFKHFRLLSYISVLMERTFSGINYYGLLAAILITICWVIFLRKLDIYETETWFYILLTLFLGGVFSFLTYPLTDILHVLFGFTLTGTFLNDFMYCIFGIGAIEETVKIIPLLLLIKYTREVNEPYDYILYASLSALGFAFMENLIYFDETNLQIIHGRALTAVITHMFDSSIIAYGLIINHYRRHRSSLLVFLGYLLLASLAHGFYDFWLVSTSVKGLGIFTIILLLVSMYMWNSFKNNALNNSVFFDKQKALDNKMLQGYLIYSLAGVMLFEYLAMAIKYSPTIANDQLLSSLKLGSYLIIFISGSLSGFRIREGIWAPIRFWGTSAASKMDEILNMSLKITAISENLYTNALLPNSGRIIRRLVVSKAPNWYQIQLDEPFEFEGYQGNILLVRAKVRYEPLEKDKTRQAAIFIVPENISLEEKDLKHSGFLFCGWAQVIVKEESVFIQPDS